MEWNVVSINSPIRFFFIMTEKHYALFLFCLRGAEIQEHQVQKFNGVDLVTEIKQ